MPANSHRKPVDYHKFSTNFGKALELAWTCAFGNKLGEGDGVMWSNRQWKICASWRLNFGEQRGCHIRRQGCGGQLCGQTPWNKGGNFFFFVDFYQGFAFLAMEACCISAWSQQTMTAGLFKHLAVCLIVLLFPISYTRSLLMLPEAICYTRTWGSPFCWCGNEARSSAEAGTALLCHCEPEQRSRVCTLLLKHFQHIWSEPMDQIAEAGVRQAEPPIYDPQISVGSVRLTKTVWRSAYRGLNSGRNGIQFLCTSAVIVNDDFFFLWTLSKVHL